ncbi:MAG: type II secretion system F family protein [Kordiimonadaceae bacterium]|jgi:type IV pilus assembly protein PilC|nr:type II secretion system F family protein [Kordiimonadaceae bacterium]
MAVTYSYKGILGNKYTEGKIVAINKDEAAFKLKEDKIIITSLEKVSGKEDVIKVKKEAKASKKVQKIPKKVPITEVITFTKKFETMVRAGLPILESIKMIELQTEHKGFRLIVNDIHQSVETGNTLSDSFEKFPGAFDNIYINLLRAGESSGKVQLFLSKLVINMEKQEKIKSSIKGAMMYPMILLIVAMAVVTLMLVFVVPVFEEMFAGKAGGLPAATQAVVNISNFLRNPLKGGVLAISIVVIFMSASFAINKNFKIKMAWHKLVLKLPLFGGLVLKSSISKIAMIQGNLRAAGVPEMEALDIAASASNNLVIKDAMVNVRRGVFSGEPLSQLFEKTPNIFPASFVALVSVGERTGNMEEMYGSIASYYEGEMDIVIEKLTAMLEPIMMVFMGVTVGGILVAMYTPMFAMGDTF